MAIKPNIMQGTTPLGPHIDPPLGPGVHPPPPDAPNWDVTNGGNPDPNWKSDYVYVGGKWVLKDNKGGKKLRPLVIGIVILVVLYLLFR